MNSVIKIDSNQGTFDLTSAKSNVDLDIPAGIGNIDLSNSYVSINTSTVVEVTGQASAAGAIGVGNPYIKYALDSANDLVISNTASLISNANFSSRKGRLEDIRRVSLLKNTLSCYQKDLAQVQSGANKLSTFEFSKMHNAHQVTEISKVSDITSREIAHEIHIPLKDIFNVCKSDGFDTSMGAHGNSRIHLEMKFKDLSVAVNDAVGTTIIEGETGKKYTDFNPITATAAIQSRTFLTSPNKYRNKSNVPFFVGQFIFIKGTKAGGASGNGAITKQTVITKVNNDTDRTITVHFADAIALVANQNLSDVKLDYETAIEAAGTSLSITGVQLVASISPESPPAVLNYTTFDSEEDSYPATVSANRQYQVPPACKNVYVMFFGSANDSIQRSGEPNLNTYRITLDNHEVTPRPVKMGSMVHLDLIQQVFANNGESLKNLRETQMVNKGANNITTIDSVGNKMIAIPIPFKSTPTQLQLELNSSTTLTGHHILFYEKVVQK